MTTMREQFIERLMLVLSNETRLRDAGVVIERSLFAAFASNEPRVMVVHRGSDPVIEEIVVIRRLKKEIAKRFPGESTRGVTIYTILRTTQLRRFRLPAPQIKRFEELPERY